MKGIKTPGDNTISSRTEEVANSRRQENNRHHSRPARSSARECSIRPHRKLFLRSSGKWFFIPMKAPFLEYPLYLWVCVNYSAIHSVCQKFFWKKFRYYTFKYIILLNIPLSVKYTTVWNCPGLAPGAPGMFTGHWDRDFPCRKSDRRYRFPFVVPP